MTFDFELTEDDFVDAQLSYVRSQYRKPKIAIPLAVFALFAIVGCIFSLIAHRSQSARQFAPMVFLVIAGAVILAYLFSGHPFRRQFRKIRALHVPLQITLSDSEIVYTSENGESKTGWGAIERWQESKGSFMLFTQPRMFFIVPKRVMQPGQIVACRELLTARIAKP